MKKIILITIIATTMMLSVGCGSKNNDINNDNNKNTELSKNDNEESKEVVYFGKVKRIVGNEVELEIAKQPQNDTKDDDNGVYKKVGDYTEEDMNYTPAKPMDPSLLESGGVEVGMSASGSENGSNYTEEMENNKLQLEYTGEIKNIIIPAGARVVNFKTIGEWKVSDIKEGSVIRLYAIGEGDSPIVNEVQIVE